MELSIILETVVSRSNETTHFSAQILVYLFLVPVQNCQTMTSCRNNYSVTILEFDLIIFMFFLSVRQCQRADPFDVQLQFFKSMLKSQSQ